MNEAPTRPVLVRVDECILLMRAALAKNDLERAMSWAGLALSVNDPRREDCPGEELDHA